MSPVWAIVANSLVRDARATKQIDALLRAGYAVEAFGLRERPDVPARFIYGAGARVMLFPSRRAIVTIVAALFCLPLAALATRWLLPGGTGGSGIVRLGVEAALALLAAGGAAIAALLAGHEAMRGEAEAETMRRSRLARLLLALLDRPAMRSLASRLTRRFVYPLQEAIRRRRILRLAARARPAIVHCHDIFTLGIGAAVKARTGAALIYDAHEIYEQMARRSPRAAERYRAILARHAAAIDGFITTNNDYAAWYAEAYPDLPRAVTIPGAEDPLRAAAYDGRLHRAAGLPPDRRILLYHGVLLAERNLETLVRAGLLLPPGWTLVVMGPGDLRCRLEAIARAGTPARDGAEEGGRVRFLPPMARAELPLWVQGAALGAIPYAPVYLNERLCSPNKLWEFPSAGVPILATDLPNLRAAIGRYGMGWVIPAESGPAEMAASVAGIGEAELAAARAGCRRFMAAESWSHYEPRLLALYASVGRRAPRERAGDAEGMRAPRIAAAG